MHKNVITIMILVLMMVLMGCQRAGSTDILLSEDDSISASSLESSLQEIEAAATITSSESATDSSSKEPLVIFVCGAVNIPGVYYLDDGKRIVDAIDAAGGFSEEADMTYVNLAAPLTDGIKLQIPTKEESKEGNITASMDSFDQSQVSSDNGNTKGNGLVNINKASREELKTLPGIGDGIASRIIDYRTENGDFTCIEDITKVSGIKDKLFSKIREHITV